MVEQLPYEIWNIIAQHLCDETLESLDQTCVFLHTALESERWRRCCTKYWRSALCSPLRSDGYTDLSELPACPHVTRRSALEAASFLTGPCAASYGFDIPLADVIKWCILNSDLEVVTLVIQPLFRVSDSSEQKKPRKMIPMWTALAQLAAVKTSARHGRLDVLKFVMSAILREPFSRELFAHPYIAHWATRVLRRAARNGHVAVVQFLLDEFSAHGIVVTMEHMRMDKNKALWMTAKRGHVDVLRCMVHFFEAQGTPFTIEDVRFKHNKALRSAAGKGHVDVVRFLVEHFRLDMGDVSAKNNEALHSCIKNGHVDTTKFLLDSFEYDDLHVVLEVEDLEIVINEGHLAMLQFLVQHSRSRRIDLFDCLGTYCVADLIRYAVHAQNLPILVFLFEHNVDVVTKCYDPHDVDGKCRDLFKTAAENGDVPMLQLLLEKLGRDAWQKDDNGKCAPAGFYVAARRGKLDVLQFMAKVFKITRVHLQGENHLALRGAAESNHLSAVQFLVEEFDLTIDDVLRTFSSYDLFARNGALIVAARSKSFSVLQYFVEHFNITHACSHGNFAKMAITVLTNVVDDPQHLEYILHRFWPASQAQLRNFHELNEIVDMMARFVNTGKRSTNLKILMDHFGFSFGSISVGLFRVPLCSVDKDAVVLATKSFDMMHFLLTNFQITKAEHGGCVFQDTRDASSEALKLIVQHFEAQGTPFTIADVRWNDNSALRVAAVNGNLDVVKFLVHHFSLTVDDVRAKDNYIIQTINHAWATSRHALQVFQFLVRHFASIGTPITADDVRTNNNHALNNAVCYGTLDFVKFLVSTFGLTAQDARATKALSGAAGRGKIDMLQYLHDLPGGLSKEDALASGIHVIVEALRHKHYVALVEHFMSQYGLTVKNLWDVFAHNSLPKVRAKRLHKILEWLGHPYPKSE